MSKASVSSSSTPAPSPAATPSPKKWWWWVVIVAAVALVALVALAVTTPSTPAPETPEVVTPVSAPAVEEPIPTPTPTPVLTMTRVYSYTPGGEGFGQWANVVAPTGATGPCGRVWQGTNLENFPWTFIICDWKVSDTSPKLKLQWPHATQLTISGSGIVEFSLWRDLAASQSDPDPYEVANVKQSPLGLAWFAQGFNGTVCINDECQRLEGGGVFQLGFPHDMQGAYRVRIVVDGGQVNFWQGEKITSVDTWPLPAATP